jgi:hypothetical protein
MGTHGPIDKKYMALMNKMAQIVDKVFNGDRTGEDRTTGFVLLIFPFGDAQQDRINYISNGERKDIIVAMKELIAIFEGRHSEEQSGPGTGHA